MEWEGEHFKSVYRELSNEPTGMEKSYPSVSSGSVSSNKIQSVPTRQRCFWLFGQLVSRTRCTRTKLVPNTNPTQHDGLGTEKKFPDGFPVPFRVGIPTVGRRKPVVPLARFFATGSLRILPIYIDVHIHVYILFPVPTTTTNVPQYYE
jgi:hypothetical protein